MAVNTKHVKDRRVVRYESFADALRDMRSLAAQERNGNLAVLGNWSLGQAINHVATWAEYAYKPNPMRRAPWIIRLASRLLKKRFLEKGLGPGFRLPGVEGGTLGTEPADTDTALARFQAGADRLDRDPPTQPSPVFGLMTREDASKLNLRHAELHMSFFKPRVP